MAVRPTESVARIAARYRIAYQSPSRVLTARRNRASAPSAARHRRGHQFQPRSPPRLIHGAGTAFFLVAGVGADDAITFRSGSPSANTGTATAASNPAASAAAVNPGHPPSVRREPQGRRPAQSAEK